MRPEVRLLSGARSDIAAETRGVAYVRSRNDVDDVFGNVRRMVTDAFQRLGNPDDVERLADRAGVFHHVRDELAHHGVEGVVELLVIADQGACFVGVHACQRVECTTQHVGGELAAMPNVGQTRDVVLLRTVDLRGGLGDLDRLVAATLEVGDDARDREDEPEVARRRLPLGDQARAFGVAVEFKLVDPFFGLQDLAEQFAIAGRKGLNGMPKDQCPNPWTAIRLRWHLLLPLLGLVALLFSGYTPLFSGTVGLALTVVLIFGAAVLTGVNGLALRGLFWALLGMACAGFFQFGVGTFFVVVALLVAITLIRQVGGDARRLAIQAMVDGARHALPVAIACALVGVIIGIINLTGVAAELGGRVIAVGQDSLFLALLLTMVICLVLGMGIPTIPNYIITSSLAAPVLLKLGVPLLVSHMFVFYFGIMADLTPPVALAAFAAASIAGVSGLKISIQAIRVAIAGFIVPFMAVYSPALMLQGGDWLDVVWIVFKALVAIAMWGAGAIGFLITPLNWPERLLAIMAASLLVVAWPWTDELGLGLIAALVSWHVWRSRGKSPA